MRPHGRGVDQHPFRDALGAQAALAILDAETGAPRSEWTFTDVLVSSMNVANGEPAPKAKQPDTFLAPATAFGLSFAKFCYRIFAANASVARETCWDIVANQSP